MKQEEVLGRVLAMFDISVREVARIATESDDSEDWIKSLNQIRLLLRMQDIVGEHGLDGITMMADTWTKADLDDDHVQQMIAGLQKVGRAAKAAIR